MDVRIEKSKPAFQPLTITIKVETEEELRDLCHLVRERKGIPVRFCHQHSPSGRRVAEANRFSAMMERASKPIRVILKSLDMFIETEE